MAYVLVAAYGTWCMVSVQEICRVIMGLLKYTNGVGHLIMSVVLACLGFGLIIYPSTDGTTKGIGVTLLLTVSSSWFIPSAARQVAQEVSQNVTDALPETDVKK